MKIILFTLFFCYALAFSNPFYTYEDGVIVLNDNNFEQALHEFEYVLVDFYAPWCGHCKTLAPEFAKAAEKIAEIRPEIKLCKIDATVEKAAAKKYEVRGYPTILLFIKGRKNPVQFFSVNSASVIVDWLLEKAKPSSQEINSVEDAEKLIAENEVVTIFFGPSTSEAFAQYLEVANDIANDVDKVVYVNTNDQALKDKFEVTSEEAIILFKKFDEGKNIFTGSFDSQSILAFIEKHRFPTIIPFDHRFAKKIFGENNPVLFLVTDATEAGVRAREAFTEVSQEIKDKIVICLATVNQPMVDMLMGTIGVPKGVTPSIRIYRPSSANQPTRKFALEGDLTVDNIKTFVDDFVNNKLRPFYKSEPVSENTHEEDVRVVVGKNYEEIVLDDNSDVLMFYYAPLCAPCKTMAPFYASLANKLKDVEGLVIGKMDLTKNEAEGLQTKGFPTIRFYPKGDKSNPIDFTGELIEEEFLEFIKKHTTVRHPKLNPKVEIEL